METKIIPVYSWYPKSETEVKRLLNNGWELVHADTKQQQCCHTLTVGGSETVVYRLEK